MIKGKKELADQDKESLTSERKRQEKNPKQVVQRQSLTTSQQHTDDQQVSEQQLP